MVPTERIEASYECQMNDNRDKTTPMNMNMNAVYRRSADDDNEHACDFLLNDVSNSLTCTPSEGRCSAAMEDALEDEHEFEPEEGRTILLNDVSNSPLAGGR